MTDLKNIPQHVAIIMDGNGRWARMRGLPRMAGHRAGVNSIKEVMEAAKETGVKILTLYTFSTENWTRPKSEVGALFRLLEEYLDKEIDRLDKSDVRLSVIGRLDGLPGHLSEKLGKAAARTRANSALILNLALNYGGRAEIIDACRKTAEAVKAGTLEAAGIDEEVFANYLYTKDLPDPDLLIRTSGEMRISNFLLWQISYSEIYITKKLWPDFKKRDFIKALSEYGRRQRRFGG